jgi:transposase
MLIDVTISGETNMIKKESEKILKCKHLIKEIKHMRNINPLSPELNPICYLLALLAHDFLYVSRIRVKSLTLRLLMSYIYIYIYGAPILDVSRSHTTTQHSR